MSTEPADPYIAYAHALAAAALEEGGLMQPDSDQPERLRTVNDQGEEVLLSLVPPFQATPMKASAESFFAGVRSAEELIAAYRSAAKAMPFEWDLPAARQSLNPFAWRFLEGLLERARRSLQDHDAARIAAWVQHFDCYVAAKAVESLLNSKADLALLEVSEERGWMVHFDHLAIRCGSEQQRAAERVTELLRREHGYVHSQVPEEVFYRFADGWSAYLLYKVLDNGQVLRLFIDQSDGGHPTQIIQHWNHVYGYTAHHLAVRATRIQSGARRVAVTLDQMIDALSERGIGIMEPTGYYTNGLLLQVFTRPERSTQIPEAIRAGLAAYGTGLERKIENGKLLELVSRKEAPPQLAQRYYRLYGLEYRPQNPLHSVAVYPYFLPEQAAHVIRTSVIT